MFNIIRKLPTLLCGCAALTACGDDAAGSPSFCTDDKADYKLAAATIVQAQLALETCRSQGAEDQSDPVNYCLLHTQIESEILSAVPCLRNAIDKDTRLGIEDRIEIEATERWLNEYLALRHE
jgi:hypothetical protein